MFDAENFIFCNLIQDTPQGDNLLGVFDQVVAQGFPTTHQPFLSQVSLRAKKFVHDQDIKIRVAIDREGKDVGVQEVTLQKANVLRDDSIRIVINFDRLVFEQPGTYHFKLYSADKLLLTRVLRVLSVEELTER